MLKIEEPTMMDTESETSKLGKEEIVNKNADQQSFLPSEIASENLEKKELAVVKIQSQFRMRKSLYEYRTMKGAVIAVVAGNEVEQQQDDNKTSSSSQTEEESKDQDDLKESVSAAVKIQSQFRMRKSLYEYRTMKGAVIAVVAGNEVEQQQDDNKTSSSSQTEEESKDQDDLKEVSAAAVKIQSQFRMRKSLYEYRTMKGAVIAVVAGNEVEQQQDDNKTSSSSQTETEEESKDQDDLKEASAAVKIQSQFRMRKSLYEYRTMKGAVIAVVAGNEVEQQQDDNKTSSSSQTEEESKDLDAKKEVSAVVKIQSQFRMRKSLYEYRTMKGAVIAVVAGNEVEQQQDDNKTSSSSQTETEEESKDLDAKKEVSAVVKIQSQFRMRKSLYEYRTMKGAVIAVVAGNEVEQRQDDFVEEAVVEEATEEVADAPALEASEEVAADSAPNVDAVEKTVVEEATEEVAAEPAPEVEVVEKEAVFEDAAEEVAAEPAPEVEAVEEAVVEKAAEEVVADPAPEVEAVEEEATEENVAVEETSEITEPDLVERSDTENVLNIHTINSEEEVVLEPAKKKIVPEDPVVGNVGCGACILM